MSSRGRHSAPGLPQLFGSAIGALSEAAGHAARGAVHEAQGLLTHAALYPTGIVDVAPVARAARRRTRSATARDLPVVMVHGYFHNRSGFYFLSRALRRRGFTYLDGLNYNAMGASIPALADQLAHRVQEVLATTGAPRVHVVGHSLGGLIARWYVQEAGGASNVEACVTIGTPHAGTFAAYAGPGQACRDMRPGSSVLRRLERSVRRTPVRFVNFYSDVDAAIIPSASSILPWSTNVENRLISEFGHSSLLVSPELIGAVAQRLTQDSGHLTAGAEKPRARRATDAA